MEARPARSGVAVASAPVAEDRHLETAWQVELRNHKDEAASVEVREPAGGDWNVVESSHPAVRDDAHSFHFDVEVPKRGKVKLSYRVRLRWC